MDSTRARAEGPATNSTLGRPAMARTLGAFYLAGAAIGAISLLLPRHPDSDLVPLIANVALAFAVGAVLYARAERLPPWVIPLFLAGGTLMITAAVYFDGHAASAYALLYVWIGVEAFYFLERWKAALQVALVGGAYACALSTIGGGPVPLQRWLLTVGTAVVAGVLVASLRSRIEGLVLRLSDAARTDPLTGLLNRRAFEELFAVELERASRGRRPLSVLVGDIDGFKLVNDRLGHHEGDAALQALAGDIEKWKRRIDVAARIGGEEFALLLPETDERGAFLVAERLRRAAHRTFGEAPVPITVSFGVATYPDHGDEADLLLRAADQALYAAKDLGKDRSVLYSTEVARLLEGVGARVPDRGEMQLATVIGLAEALDIRDTGTARHSQTVGRYARLMAEALDLPVEQVERIRIAGVLHDVGKIGISDLMLSKPGPLDENEWEEMRTHPEIAGRLLAREEFDDLRSWILAHHERPDGTGYPKGLVGDAIPLEARILAVADAYEAMTADRVYRPALAEDAARAELVTGSGSQFDREVVGAFLGALDRQRELDAAA
jgi:diguanylate cyclase (GGDEF)-like protein